MEDDDSDCIYMKKPTRRLWSKSETLAFLTAAHKRKNELSICRKKKFAYEKIRNDLVKKGVLPSVVTVSAMENKLKTLIRTYKDPVARKADTFEKYRSMVEDILICEAESNNLRKNKLHGGVQNRTKNSSEIPDSQDLNESSNAEYEYLYTEEHILPDATEIVETMYSDGKKVKVQVDKTSMYDTSVSPAPSTTSPTPSTSNINTKQDYYEKKLQLSKQRQADKWKIFKEMELNAEKRFKESEKRREFRHAEKMVLLKKILTKLS